MKNLIRVDKTDYEYCAIDTRPWLDHVLGPNLPAWQEFLEHKNAEHKASFDNERDWNWSGTRPYTGRYWISWPEMQAAIAEYLLATTGEEYVPATDIGNVYNNENDFSNVFQFQPWVPMREASQHTKTGEWYCDEWYYRDDVFMAVEIHLGGDVRGNYGTVELRGPVNNLSEAGFLDWKLGWYVTAYCAKEGRHTVESADVDGEFLQGYHACPTYQLSNSLKDTPRWSESRDCFVGVMDGRFVDIHPDYHVEGA